MSSRREDGEELHNLFDAPASAPVRDGLLLALMRWRSQQHSTAFARLEAGPLSKVARQYALRRDGTAAEEQLAELALQWDGRQNGTVPGTRVL